MGAGGGIFRFLFTYHCDFVFSLSTLHSAHRACMGNGACDLGEVVEDRDEGKDC